jgi:Icc-related predicted phosphoesterase
MKILCLTDLHGDERCLRTILEASTDVDMLLMGGDLTNFGTPNQAENLVKIAQQTCPEILAVAGNCDSALIDQRLIELGISLFGRGVVREQTGFFGVSAMPPWMGMMYELEEPEIAAALESGHAEVAQAERLVLLSHAPPRNCRLDCTQRGDHVGSTAVRQIIDDRQPALVVCGHIHEARGVERIRHTTVVNCGPAFRGSYAVATFNDKLEVELRNAAV